MNKKTAAILTLLALSAPVALRALEIPLESFGKGTKIAYVNMHKVFEAYPETEKARLDLTRIIEEKRSEISAKKEEIAQLKGEIDFIKRQQTSVDPSDESRAAAAEEKKKEELVPVEDPQAPDATTSLTVPENSPLKFLFSPPDESTSTAEAEEEKPAVKVSTGGPQILPGIPSLKPQLEEKEADLSRKQADLEAFVGATQQEIKDLEEGKTMTLLARIYKTLEEISAKDGYTIVVDKQNILYGENTVDITESVIWRLSNPAKR